MTDSTAPIIAPLTKEKEPRFWTLWYRFGTVPIATKSFQFDGNLEQATIRARKHCEIMRYRYVFVRPMMVDLEYQESLYIAGKYRELDSQMSD